MPVSLKGHTEMCLWQWQEEAQCGQYNRRRGLRTGRGTAVFTESDSCEALRGEDSRRDTLSEKRKTHAKHEKEQAPPMATCESRHRYPCGRSIEHPIMGN